MKNLIVLLSLLSHIAWSAELSFKRQPDSFFDPIAKYVDKDKGLIYMLKESDSHPTEMMKEYYNPNIYFYDNKDLKGEVVAKYASEKGGFKVYIGDKEVCRSIGPRMFQSDSTTPIIICKTDFFYL